MNSMLIVLLGPSASGKSRFQKQLSLPKIITTTTRPKRPGEREGADYYFISPEAFKQKVEQGDFVEWTIYSGHYYGIQRLTLESCLKTQKTYCLILDSNGAQVVKNMWPERVIVLGVYAGKSQTSERLRLRGDAETQKRMERFEEDMEGMLALSDLIYHSDSGREETVKNQIEGLLIDLITSKGLSNPL